MCSSFGRLAVHKFQLDEAESTKSATSAGGGGSRDSDNAVVKKLSPCLPRVPQRSVQVDRRPLGGSARALGESVQ